MAKLLESSAARERIIYGVSSGTLDDKLAQAFEAGTPLVSKRIASLHWLQDNGFRTYGMICPSLPNRDYAQFASTQAEAIRADRCEHVWGEVINVRGQSMTRTASALRQHGYAWEASELERVSTDKEAWEAYARETFNAHAELYHGTNKLRFLQYVTKASLPWWSERADIGAICL